MEKGKPSQLSILYNEIFLSQEIGLSHNPAGLLDCKHPGGQTVPMSRVSVGEERGGGGGRTQTVLFTGSW